MKLNIESKIKKESITKLVQKSVDVGKKVASSTKENVTYAIEKAKAAALMNKLKKLNPVFPQQFESEDFKLPNIVMIVDDAVRRGNKLCEGAVGWLSNDAGVEIFCLYDEAIEFSKIQFIPAAICDAIYYVDSFDRNRFIRTDCIFSKAHEERIAELKHIAHCLGAKKCSIEINESQADIRVQNRSITAKETLKGEDVQESVETSLKTSGSDSRRGRVEIEFEGNTSCRNPELKWFSYDDNIKRLIEMRIDGANSIKSETIEISGSSTATMSQKTAYAIDSAVGAGASLSSQVEKERNSTLIYHIEF
ncbi:MAG: hypothetical protein IJE90_00185 [Clostridia bacterium]|nr:hypothetical protein [Clostridia bacterium]